jgi:hypothetical protein
VVYDFVHTFKCKKTVCGFQCDALRYGLLWGYMRDNSQCKLWPRTAASDIGVSIYQLLWTLRYLDHGCNDVLDSVRFGRTFLYYHRGCHPRDRLVKLVLPIIKNLPTPVLEIHREHMKKVNAEIGVLENEQCALSIRNFLRVGPDFIDSTP